MADSGVRSWWETKCDELRFHGIHAALVSRVTEYSNNTRASCRITGVTRSDHRNHFAAFVNNTELRIEWARISLPNKRSKQDDALSATARSSLSANCNTVSKPAPEHAATSCRLKLCGRIHQENLAFSVCDKRSVFHALEHRLLLRMLLYKFMVRSARQTPDIHALRAAVASDQTPSRQRFQLVVGKNSTVKFPAARLQTIEFECEFFERFRKCASTTETSQATGRPPQKSPTTSTRTASNHTGWYPRCPVLSAWKWPIQCRQRMVRGKTGVPDVSTASVKPARPAARAPVATAGAKHRNTNLRTRHCFARGINAKIFQIIILRDTKLKLGRSTLAIRAQNCCRSWSVAKRATRK